MAGDTPAASGATTPPPPVKGFSVGRTNIIGLHTFGQAGALEVEAKKGLHKMEHRSTNRSK